MTFPTHNDDLPQLLGTMRNEVELLNKVVDELLKKLEEKDSQIEAEKENNKMLRNQQQIRVSSREHSVSDMKAAYRPALLPFQSATPKVEIDLVPKYMNLPFSGSTRHRGTHQSLHTLGKCSSTASIENANRIPVNNQRNSPSIYSKISPNNSDKKEFSISSIEQEILKDITNGCGSETCREIRGSGPKFSEIDLTLLKEMDDGEFKIQMNDFLKKCPYIEKLKQDSEKYRSAIGMLHTLATYNDLMKKVFENKVDVRGNEKYRAFVQKNRELRISIKSLLCEERESSRRISELKQSLQSYGITTRLNHNVTKELEKSKPGKQTQTKRELIKFRDFLLEQNDKLLFIMSKKMI